MYYFYHFYPLSHMEKKISEATKSQASVIYRWWGGGSCWMTSCILRSLRSSSSCTAVYTGYWYWFSIATYRKIWYIV